jgi:hypothetical protein
MPQTEPFPQIGFEADLSLLVEETDPRNERDEAGERLGWTYAKEFLSGLRVMELDESHESLFLSQGMGEGLSLEPVPGLLNPCACVRLSGDLTTHEIERIVKEEIR